MSIAEVEISEWRIVIPDISEEEIERQLAEEGLIRMPLIPKQSAKQFSRINIDGKPISETIIEERR